MNRRKKSICNVRPLIALASPLESCGALRTLRWSPVWLRRPSLLCSYVDQTLDAGHHHLEFSFHISWTSWLSAAEVFLNGLKIDIGFPQGTHLLSQNKVEPKSRITQRQLDIPGEVAMQEKKEYRSSEYPLQTLDQEGTIWFRLEQDLMRNNGKNNNYSYLPVFQNTSNTLSHPLLHFTLVSTLKVNREENITPNTQMRKLGIRRKSGFPVVIQYISELRKQLRLPDLKAHEDPYSPLSFNINGMTHSEIPFQPRIQHSWVQGGATLGGNRIPNVSAAGP